MITWVRMFDFCVICWEAMVCRFVVHVLDVGSKSFVKFIDVVHGGLTDKFVISSGEEPNFSSLDI